MTKNDIKLMLEAYKEAEKAVLLAKEYWLKGRKMSREDLPEIRKGRQEWERKLAAHRTHRGIRLGSIVPR